MKAVAIIPARGGSKGISRKNLRVLAGKPLVAHTIVSARNSQHIHRVIVSTDDREIATVAGQYGAEVVQRPPEISGDKASSESALLHALQHLSDTEHFEPDIVVFLQCTSPLTTPEDIDGTVQALLEANADSALAVAPFHYFLWEENESGDAVGINHDKNVRLMRQDRDGQFRETGAVYAMKTQGFKKAKHRFFGKTAMYVTPPERVLEIDDLMDFEIAESLIGNYRMQPEWEKVKLLALDFDGVMTDNRVEVDQDGHESVQCHRGDGMGIGRLKEAGIDAFVISTETNPVVSARCRKLGIECFQGYKEKLSVLQKVVKERSKEAREVAYVGNDVNDLECMRWVGFPVAVADAVQEVRTASCYVTVKPGGQGAVREVCELIISNKR